MDGRTTLQIGGRHVADIKSVDWSERPVTELHWFAPRPAGIAIRPAASDFIAWLLADHDGRSLLERSSRRTLVAAYPRHLLTPRLSLRRSRTKARPGHRRNSAATRNARHLAAH